MLPEKALIHSNASWLGSGYGQQAGILAKQLALLGIKPAISGFCGITGARIAHEGIPHFPAGFNPYGLDVIRGHAAEWDADLVITVMDAMVLEPQIMADLGAVHWMPVDCAPLSVLDRIRLRESGCTPIAISRFGRDQLSEAGFAPFFVPHGIDTELFSPGDGNAARDRLGIPRDAFVVGINAANNDRERKAFPEQMAAFALFRQAHPDALLLMHSLAAGPGTDLNMVAGLLGIRDAIRWSDRHKYTTGGFTPADMAAWYQVMRGDGGGVFSGATYAEGFGLPLLEAQASGIPVVATDHSAMTENCGAGWLVQGEPWLHREHQAWWAKPRVSEIAETYEAAWGARGDEALADKARSFALAFDYRALVPEWERVLGAIMKSRQDQ